MRKLFTSHLALMSDCCTQLQVPSLLLVSLFKGLSYVPVHCIYRIAMRALTIQCSTTNSDEKHCLKTPDHAWLPGATLAVSQASNCDTLLLSFTTSMLLHTLAPVHHSRVHARESLAGETRIIYSSKF